MYVLDEVFSETSCPEDLPPLQVFGAFFIQSPRGAHLHSAR